MGKPAGLRIISAMVEAKSLAGLGLYSDGNWSVMEPKI
jgi:hypothetical protein